MNQSKKLHNNPLNSLKWNQNFKDINFEDNNYDADWAYTRLEQRTGKSVSL